MKALLLLTTLVLSIITPFEANSQVVYGPDFKPKIRGLASETGQNEDYAVFTAPFKSDMYGYPDGHIYYSISKKTGKVNQGKVSYKASPYRKLVSFCVFKDAIYELVIMDGEFDTYKLFKKSIASLEVEEEVLAFELQSKEFGFASSRARLYLDEYGLYVKFAFEGRVHKIQRYTLDLELEWEIDLSESLPLEEIDDFMRGVHHDEITGNLILAVDLSGNEEYKFFEKRPEAENAVIALIIIDKEGNYTPFIPKFDDPITYSNNDYYYDAEKKELTAIYRIHFEDPNDASGLTRRCGYSFFKWNVETNALVNQVEKRCTFGDVILPNRTDFFSSGDVAKDKSKYFIGLESATVNKLENGCFLMEYPFYYYPSKKYIVCLNSDGGLKWRDVSNKKGELYITPNLTSITSDGLSMEVRDLESGEVVKSVSKKEIISSVEGKVHPPISFADGYANKAIVCIKKGGGLFSYAIVDYDK